MGASCQERDTVALITLDNPPVNALGCATHCELPAGVERAVADAALVALVITGGGRAFSGGADIKEFGSPSAIAEPNLLSPIKLPEDRPKPVVAAINDTCMSGGLELEMGCHARVAAPGGDVALPEVKIGLIPGAGARSTWVTAVFRFTVPSGCAAQTLIALGDPLFAGVAAFANNGTDADYDKRCGEWHDGMEYFGLSAAAARDDASSSRALLAINHEWVTQTFLHPAGPTAAPRPAAEVVKEFQAKGVTVVEIAKGSNGRFAYVPASVLNRRVTAESAVDLPVQPAAMRCCAASARPRA